MTTNTLTTRQAATYIAKGTLAIAGFIPLGIRAAGGMIETLDDNRLGSSLKNDSVLDLALGQSKLHDDVVVMAKELTQGWLANTTLKKEDSLEDDDLFSVKETKETNTESNKDTNIDTNTATESNTESNIESNIETKETNTATVNGVETKPSKEDMIQKIEAMSEILTPEQMSKSMIIYMTNPNITEEEAKLQLGLTEEQIEALNKITIQK